MVIEDTIFGFDLAFQDLKHPSSGYTLKSDHYVYKIYTSIKDDALVLAPTELTHWSE